MSQHIEEAARAITEADALFIGAGAGMGVDSGLPDFRGDEGFWNAYPPFRELNLSVVELANPSWFARDPELAWGFYGHRLHLYRDTDPHAGGIPHAGGGPHWAPCGGGGPHCEPCGGGGGPHCGPCGGGPH